MGKTTNFEFGRNSERPEEQLGLFSGGSAERLQGPLAVGGAGPTPPLQVSEIRLEHISMALADSYSIELHYLHRTAKNSKIAFGIYARGEIHGVMIWGLPVAKVKRQFGNKWCQLELRRMYCDEHLPKNSESRCLAVSARLIKKLFPNCTMLIAYSDLSMGHKGGIYKAAGWVYSHKVNAEQWKKRDGSLIQLPRHNRTESGDKIKWVKPI